MARPGISKLGLPPRNCRPHRRTTRKDGVIKFETRDACIEEDLLRAALLRASAQTQPEYVDPKAARDLARRLERGAHTGKGARTPASSIWMRRRRIRSVGWLWALHDSAANRPIAIAHILPTGWIIPAAELLLVNPKELLKRLRSDLNRAGGTKANGFLSGSLHGEYDPEDECFHLHVHCIVAKGMIAVVRKHGARERARLKKISNPNLRRSPAMVQKKLDRLPGPISYCFQSHWTMKKYQNLITGGWERGERRRIPEPWHSVLLLWIDQWELEDLTLMMKLSVRQGKLHVKR